LRECASCREEYIEALRVFYLYGLAFPPEITPEQLERIKSGVFERTRSRLRRRRIVALGGLAAAQALAVWAVISFILPQPSATVGVATGTAATAVQQSKRLGESEPAVSQRTAVPEPKPGEPTEETPQTKERTVTADSVATALPETSFPPGPSPDLSPAQTYGRLWQESVGMVYARRPLSAEEKKNLVDQADRLNALLDKDLDSAPAWNHLVRIYEKLGDLEASDAAFEGHLKALSKEGNQAGIVEALVDRGNRLLRLGAGLQAVKHYSRVINDYGDAPGSERAWYGLGNYYLQVGDPARARKYLEHVCEAYEFAEGVVRDAHYTLANVSSNCGDYDGAVKTMERLLEKPCDIGSRAYGELRIGDFYRYAGKTAKAVHVYRKVLKEYPAVACVTIQARNMLNRMQAAALGSVIP
jgi:hypothetical protein